jgi:phage baseplate assembly protein W|tara:strand:- start:122 stop:520 length:399 start_codon:yes stop_codon:yes gene_type:complete
MANDKNFLTPALPLKEAGELDYLHVDEYGDLIRQNFKNLLLTIPGERMMDPDFGVGIQRFLFENGITASSDIRSEAARKVGKYMPFVSLQNVLVEPGEEQNSLTVRIFYSVPSLAIDEYINLSFNSDGTVRS